MKRQKAFAPRTEKREAEYNYMLGFSAMELLTEEDEQFLLANELPELNHESLRTYAFAKVATGITNIGASLNEKGAHIKTLNNAFDSLGYSVSQDSSFYDSNLEDAIKSFQLENELLPLGYLNAKTLWALNDTLDYAEFQKNYNTAFVTTEGTTPVDFSLKPKVEKATESQESDSLRFVIPVPNAMTPKSSNIHVFKYIFNVNETRAAAIFNHVLKDKSGNYAAIWEPDFLEFTEKDQKKGFKVFRVSLAFYNKYANQKIASSADHTQALFPDWEEQMQWFNNLKSGREEDLKLRRTIFKKTDQRFKSLTGIKHVDNSNQNVVKIYNELLYEAIKNQRGENLYEIKDYRTRERVQQLINNFSAEQKRVFDAIMSRRDLNDSYYYNGSYDEAMEQFVTSFNAFYQMINDEHFKGQQAGKQDNYEALIKLSLERLNNFSTTKLSKHKGTSTGQRYTRLKIVLNDPERKSEVLITLVRGLTREEQQLFWKDSTLQQKLANDLRGTHLVQAIATHKVNYEQKIALLSKKPDFTVPYAIYRELIRFSDNGQELLTQNDPKYKHYKLVNFVKGKLIGVITGGSNEIYDPLLERRGFEMPSSSIIDKEEEIGHLIQAWNAQDSYDLGLRYTKEEQAYDQALQSAGIDESTFEVKKEALEGEFIPWFQKEAIKQAHNILEASEQFIYAEYNKLIDLGVQDLMTDMGLLRPQFELLNQLYKHHHTGLHYVKDQDGNLIAAESPGGRAIYGEKYHTLRKKIIGTLRGRHPLLYDAFDRDLYEIHRLYDAYRNDPKTFKAEMGVRFEQELGEKQQAIFDTRKNLRVDGAAVWKLQGVIVYTMKLLGIYQTGDSFEIMVQNRLQESIGVPLWVYAGLIGLAVIGGPAVAAAATVGLAVASGADVVIQYQDYSIKSDAANAVVAKEDLIQLSDDPSAIWLIVAIVGLALDVLPAIKAFSQLSKVAKIQTAADLAKFNKQLDELVAATPQLTRDKIKILRARAKAKHDFHETINRAFKESFMAPLGGPWGAIVEIAASSIKHAFKMRIYDFEEFYLRLLKHNKFKEFLAKNNLTDLPKEQKDALNRLFNEKLEIHKARLEKNKTLEKGKTITNSNSNKATKKIINQNKNVKKGTTADILKDDLYHGTTKTSAENIRKHGIDLSRTTPGQDFNVKDSGAFYLSASQKDTKAFLKWRQKKAISQLKDEGVKNVEVTMDLVTFKIPADELSKLNIKVFDGVSDEWRKFVTDARKNILIHDYDVVIGPKLANPYLLKSWTKARALKKEIQIAFTSKKGVDMLNKYIIK